MDGCMPYYENLFSSDWSRGSQVIYQIKGSKKGSWYHRVKREVGKGVLHSSSVVGAEFQGQ